MAGPFFVSIAIIAATFSQQPQSEKPNVPAIMIERTGGFAGAENRVSVFADGKVIDGTGKIRHVRPSSVEEFIRSVEKVGAPAPDKAAVPQGYCFDCFMYTIKIPKDEAGKTFVFEEPITSHSGKEPEGIRVIRDFLAVVFSFRNKE